jgi:hypothetical protein
MNLLMQFKYYILAFLVGATVTVGTMTCVNRSISASRNAAIEKLKEEALVLRGQAQEARKEALTYKDQAKELREALAASVVNSDKLKKELDKIKVPPPPVNPPQYINEIVDDCVKWGLNPLVGASNTIGRSAFGIRRDETQILWQWGAQAQRVPALEFKIQKYSEVVASLGNDRDLAVKLADTKTLEATKWEQTADLHQEEADKLREATVKMQKQLNAASRRKWIYAGAAAVVTGLTVNKLKR